MSDWIKSVLETLSYPGLVLLMFLENVFPPIPSELIVPLAGFFSTTGDMTVVGIIVAGTLGSVLGAIPLYYLGRVAGEKRLRRWCDRHGRWVGLSGDDIDKSTRWFDRHGARAVFLCRLVPGIRSLISIPAGLARMPLPQFLVYSAMGSAIWTTALALAGRALGRNYDKVEKIIGPLSTAVIVGIVVAIVIRAIRHQRRPQLS